MMMHNDCLLAIRAEPLMGQIVQAAELKSSEVIKQEFTGCCAFENDVLDKLLPEEDLSNPG